MRLQVTGDGESLCFYCRGKLTNQLEKSQKYHYYCFETYSNYVPPIYNGYELPKNHITFLKDLEDMIRDLQPGLLVDNKLPINVNQLPPEIPKPYLKINTNTNGINSLYFEKIPFTKFPKSLAKITTLELFYIMDSDLNNFPRSICKLNHLESLTIEDCCIESIPKGISNLINLKEININYTDLITLPDSISKCHNLHYLNLHDNHALKRLPKSLNNLENLQEIVIYRTPMNEYNIRRRFPNIYIQSMSPSELHNWMVKEGSFDDGPSEY